LFSVLSVRFFHEDDVTASIAKAASKNLSMQMAHEEGTALQFYEGKGLRGF